MLRFTATLHLRWGPSAIRPITWRQLSHSSPKWDRRNSVILGSWEMGKSHPYSSSSPGFLIYKPKRGGGVEALNSFSSFGCQRWRGWFSPDSQHCQSFILCNKTSGCCSPSVMDSSVNREVHNTSSVALAFLTPEPCSVHTMQKWRLGVCHAHKSLFVTVGLWLAFLTLPLAGHSQFNNSS